MFTNQLLKSKNVIFVFTIVILFIVVSVLLKTRQVKPVSQDTFPRQPTGKIISGAFNPDNQKTDLEWEKILTKNQYYILRKAGTEIPFSGELTNENRKGTYYSVGCDSPLFRSEQKFDSGTGWPSFWAPIEQGSVVLRTEELLGDDRIEVLDTCGNHLGHVFDDGPKPTGKRYCINSIALKFVPDNVN